MKGTNQTLGNLPKSKIVDWQGVRVGVLGVVEADWLVTLSQISMDDVDYVDFCTAAKELALELRAAGADIVIALTHMRLPNDIILSNTVKEIDLILGGHDHDDVHIISTHDTHVIKSGCDFRMYSHIEVKIAEGKVKDVHCDLIRVDAAEKVDDEIALSVKTFNDELEGVMGRVIGHTTIELDSRFSAIRSGETNIGNYIADVMRDATRADCALYNSGTLRADKIIPQGQLTMRDLVSLLPMADPLSTIQLTGQQLLDALENGVSKYPALEGRFPQISGVTFAFDPTKSPRVLIESVFVNEERIDLTRNYVMVTKHYCYQGKDGYSSIAAGKLICGDIIDLRSCILENLRTLNVLNAFASGPRHRSSSMDRVIKKFKSLSKFNHGHRKSSLVHLEKLEERLAELPLGNSPTSLSPPLSPRSGAPPIPKYAIHPEIDGRIFCVNASKA